MPARRDQPEPLYRLSKEFLEAGAWPETRFNFTRGAIFGYHRAQFEESSGECRLIPLLQSYGVWEAINERVEYIRKCIGTSSQSPGH